MEIEKWIFDIFENEISTNLRLQFPKEKYDKKNAKILENHCLNLFKAAMNRSNPYLVDRGSDTLISRLKDTLVGSIKIYVLSSLLIKKTDVNESGYHDEYKVKFHLISKEMRDSFISKVLYKYDNTHKPLNEALIFTQNIYAAHNSTILKALMKLNDHNKKREDWITVYSYVMARDLIEKIYNNHYNQTYIDEWFAHQNLTESLIHSLDHHSERDKYFEQVNQIVLGNDIDYDKFLSEEKRPSFLKSLFGL